MTLIKWHPSFDVNIELIDEQHKMLVKTINCLHNAICVGKDRDVLEELIRQLGVYASMHFAREEYYLDLSSYPNTIQHKKEHKYFESKIKEFENNLYSSKQRLSGEILKFLINWLINHIIKSDKKFEPYLRKKGIR